MYEYKIITYLIMPGLISLNINYLHRTLLCGTQHQNGATQGTVKVRP